jgi:hypothetical protein
MVTLANKSRVLLVVGLGIAVIVGVTFFASLKPGLILIRLISVTNENENHVVVFQVTNVYNRPIQYRFAPEIKAESGWPIENTANGNRVPFAGSSSHLSGRESTLVMISGPPTNTWRLLVGYEKVPTKYDEWAFRFKQRLFAWRLGFIAERIPCEKNKLWIVPSGELLQKR